MTKQEELTYLFGILSEASKWNRSDDDNRDLVRLEVEERIQKLLGNGGEPDENGLVQSVSHPDRPAASPRAKTEASNEAKRRYRETHIRAWFNGQQGYFPKEDVVIITTPWNRPKNVHKDSEEYKQYLAKTNGQEVNKLGDELWKEHENGKD